MGLCHTERGWLLLLFLAKIMIFLRLLFDMGVSSVAVLSLAVGTSSLPLRQEQVTILFLILDLDLCACPIKIASRLLLCLYPFSLPKQQACKFNCFHKIDFLPDNEAE